MSTGHAENPHAGQGSVLLDIGDDIGAVVVAMPPSMEGEEVEIRPDRRNGHHGGHPYHHLHVAVVNRPVEGGQVPSLVFPEVTQGRYGLFLKHSDVRRMSVTVAGGQVTSVEWPGDGDAERPAGSLMSPGADTSEPAATP